MISKDEIKKLADLARIEIKDEEQEKLAQEMDAILGYVKSIQGFQSDGDLPNGDLGNDVPRNVLREDENPTESETYSKELIAEFPKSENNYLKVKKIL